MTSFHNQLDPDQINSNDSKWKYNKTSSVSLLDMPDIPAQPNRQEDNKHMNLLDKNMTQINLNSTNCLNETLEIFDPLRQPAARLPTPKRPSTHRHFSADHFHKTSLLIPQDTTPTVQLDPTPPSSPGKRIRHSSITKLMSSKEKLNLSDFDPLITTPKKKTPAPVPAINTSSLTTTANDLLILSPLQSSTTTDETSSQEMINDQLPLESNQPNNFARRPSFPPSNDLFQEHLFTKEREKSKRLDANLVSAQGVMSQPPPIDLLCDSPPRTISDRLQSFVDPPNLEQAMTPQYALNRYQSCLSDYEKTEILKYPHVYFVGSQAKKVMATTSETQQNFGYDDEKGDYQIKMKDHLKYRYEIMESLGKGSFGQVVKCRDHMSNMSDPFVAVKIIRNKKRFHTQAQTEVKILEQLMKWDPTNKYYNVRMLDHFYFREHLCIVFECLSLNLYEILQQNGFQGFSMGLVKRFGYQILMALTLLSEHNVIHCDMKPENILLKQPDRSGIRVIDYGSSCYVNEKVYTYIQSRFYRAPEVILGLEYGLPIDMWSTGCILAELYTGHPIFPGENEQDQLACIMQILGVPKKDYLDRCTRRKQFFDIYDHPRKAINSKGKKRKPSTLTLEDALKRSPHDQVDRDFVDFVRRCLTWEPAKRMKPAEALNHPWIQTMRK